MSAPPDTKRNSNAYLAAVFFAPTALIVALGILLTFSLLKGSAVRLDDAQQDAERRLARSVVMTLVTSLEKSTADYANWDDMYDQFRTRPSAQWVKENLGPYATDAFSLSHILVIGADGSIKYAFMSKAADGAPELADLDILNAFAQSTMRSWQPGKFKAIGGAMSLGGRPHLAAISPIAVNSETRVALQEKPENTLVFVRALDDEHLAEIASGFGLTGLKAVNGGDGTFALTNPLGGPAGLSLTWTRSQVGSQFVTDALGPITLVGATVILLFIVLGCVWTLIVARIRQAALAAEGMSHSKSLFIANMTHELRTPLNAIIGFSELMSREAFGPITVPKYKEYAIDIAASGNHLLGIVNNILLFSKMEARRQDLEVGSLDLEHAVADVVRVMQVEADRRNIRLTSDRFSAPVSVEADPQALRQILFNVIGNAIKFSRSGSQVEIKPAGAMPSGAYELQIVDHGCGIPAKTQSQLGSAFVQADNSFTRKHQGTGLGLAISIGLAESMGGSIKIQSAENVGTTVSICLRLSTEGVGAPHASEDASRAA